MNPMELCGEYAVTLMIQSYFEILWYGCGYLTVAFSPFSDAKFQVLLLTTTINLQSFKKHEFFEV